VTASSKTVRRRRGKIRSMAAVENEKPPKCVACGATTVPIVYGEPPRQLGEQAARGEIILGGCVIGEDDPEWGCVECRKRRGDWPWR
jgi:hypothetical protein